jgi:hypothetical protein
MFAVGIDNLDLNSLKKYFSVIVDRKIKGKTISQTIPVRLVQCNVEDWNKVSPNFTSTFNRVGLS